MYKDLRRTFALMRDHNILYCAICGCLINKKDTITLDHHMPKSKGGDSSSKNLLPAHKVCNEIKADLMPDEFDKVKTDRFKFALDHYNLKRRDKYIIKQFLNRQSKTKSL